ncbi:MAG TPA: Imm52 family immunity protein [Caulobacteraceae bacterium]
MTEAAYRVLGVWSARATSPAAIAKTFLSTLDKMSAADSLLTNWGNFKFHEDGSRTGVSLDAVRADFSRFVTGCPSVDYEGEPNGFSVGMVSDFAPEMEPDDRTAVSGVHAGDPTRDRFEFWNGSYLGPANPDVVTYPRYRLVFRTLVNAWSPAWARATCSVPGKYPAEVSGDPTFPYSGFQMPWMAYLAPDRAGPVKPPPQVITERTSDGGLIMIAAETRLIPGDPVHMKASRAIAEIMIEHSGEPTY